MVLGGRNHRLRQTPRVGWSSRPCWCRRSAPRAHATQKRYLALRKHGSATRHSISPSRAARRQARAFAPRGAVCLSLSQYGYFDDWQFSTKIDENLLNLVKLRRTPYLKINTFRRKFVKLGRTPFLKTGYCRRKFVKISEI